jgi:methyl-accepting chemotaxis protein
MRQQAAQLVEAVAAFHTGSSAGAAQAAKKAAVAPAPERAAAPAPAARKASPPRKPAASAPAAAPARVRATNGNAGGDQHWQEF